MNAATEILKTNRLIAELEAMAKAFHAAHDSDGNPDECAMRDIGYNGGKLFAEAASALLRLRATEVRLYGVIVIECAAVVLLALTMLWIG